MCLRVWTVNHAELQLQNIHCSTEHSCSCPVQMITARFTKGWYWIYTISVYKSRNTLNKPEAISDHLWDSGSMIYQTY